MKTGPGERGYNDPCDFGCIESVKPLRLSSSSSSPEGLVRHWRGGVRNCDLLAYGACEVTGVSRSLGAMCRRDECSRRISMVSNWVYCLVEKTRNHRSGTSQDEELNAPRPQKAPVTPIGPTCTGVIELSQRLQRRVRAAVSHIQPIIHHPSSFNHSSFVSAD